MAAILMDIDGVLHVSGEPIPGAVEAIARLRAEGHRLRFVTNDSTRCRATLVEELRGMGHELEDDDLQTTPIAAAEQLGGRRVYALVMSAIVPDLAGIELVGDSADAVLVGGCDETVEPNQVFSYMNLARAFSEIQAGADLFCLHRNPWWQTSRGPMLDGGAFVAALEYATGVEATRDRKAERRRLRRRARRPRRRARADVDGHRRSRAGHPRRAALRDEDPAPAHRQVQAGHARALEHGARRGAELDRAGARLDQPHAVTRVGVDLIEIGRVRRSLERYAGFKDRCFTPAEQAYCDSRKNPAESYAGRFAGKEAVGKALGFGVARAFAWKDIEIAGRPKPSVRLSGRVAAWAERVEAGAIDLSMTHSRELASAVAVVDDR